MAHQDGFFFNQSDTYYNAGLRVDSYKPLKQRFSLWYNRSHERYGTLWAERADGSERLRRSFSESMQSHRELIFGKRASDAGLPETSRRKVLKVLEQEDALLPKATVLRCRVRYCYLKKKSGEGWKRGPA